MKSGNLDDRGRAILAHIARYRLTFQEIVSALLFAGKDPQKALDALRDGGHIQVRKGFGGNRSAYELTPRGAKAAGLGRERSRSPGTDADSVNLAILGFCFLKGRPRIRLERAELRELFGDRQPLGRYHCLEYSLKAKQVHHVYVPGDATPPDDIADLTAEHVGRALGLAWLRPWVDNDVYSHAILLDVPEREAEVKRALDEVKVENRGRLKRLAHVHVEVVPRSTTLEEALRDLA